MIHVEDIYRSVYAPKDYYWVNGWEIGTGMYRRVYSSPEAYGDQRADRPRQPITKLENARRYAQYIKEYVG